ncbi:MAG: DNA pilot protein [Microvirus sp.]|nr:MAG: DNA pilot protein [Microvirus sp.]
MGLLDSTAGGAAAGSSISPGWGSVIGGAIGAAGSMFGASSASSASQANNQANQNIAIMNALSTAQGIERQAQSQRETNQMNYAMNQENRDIAIQQTNTAHQREIQDLAAAGLNPILSGMGGQGASSASMNPSVAGNPYEGMGQTISSANKTTADLQANTNSNRMQAALQKGTIFSKIGDLAAGAIDTYNKTRLTDAQVQNIRADSLNKVTENPNIAGKLANITADTANKQAEYRTIDQRYWNMLADLELTGAQIRQSDTQSKLNSSLSVLNEANTQVAGTYENLLGHQARGQHQENYSLWGEQKARGDAGGANYYINTAGELINTATGLKDMVKPKKSGGIQIHNNMKLPGRN